MKTRGQRQRKVVSVLDDAKPSRVSLVSVAANQHAFTHVRSASGAEIKTRVREREVSNDAVHVRSLAFAATAFAEAADVDVYMREHNYTDYEIEAAEGGGFVVRASDDELTDISEIAIAAGVTATVGKPVAKDPVNPGATTQVEERADAPDEGDELTHRQDVIQRYSEWLSADLGRHSDARTIAEVMAFGADGLPPAYEQVQYALNVAMANAFRRRDTASVDALLVEFGTLIKTLARTFDSATVPNKDTAHRRDAGEEVMSTKPNENEAAAGTTPAVTEAAPAAAKQAEQAEQRSAAEAEAKPEDAEAAPAAAEGAAPAAGSELLTEMRSFFSDVTSRLEKLEQRAAEPATPPAQTEQRSEPATAPARKSITVDTTTEQRSVAPVAELDEETKKDIACRERMTRSAFGFV